MPKNIDACPSIKRSIELSPRVSHYQSAILSTIPATLQLALLPEPSSRAKGAQKAARFVFPLQMLSTDRMLGNCTKCGMAIFADVYFPLFCSLLPVWKCATLAFSVLGCKTMLSGF